MLHILALSRSALVVRHWFEINLDDASMEHGARIELRELAPAAHRGSESAAQVIAVDRPLWRADLFDRHAAEPGSFGAAHYHPEFSGNEPSDRVWDPALTADPWRWLGDQVASAGAAAGGRPWPLDPADASELPGLADEVVALARRFSPVRCDSPAECFRLTSDVRPTVRLMISYLERPDLLDVAWVAPWMAGDSGRGQALIRRHLARIAAAGASAATVTAMRGGAGRRSRPRPPAAATPGLRVAAVVVVVVVVVWFLRFKVVPAFRSRAGVLLSGPALRETRSPPQRRNPCPGQAT